MAQLSSIICTGSARFLNNIYGNLTGDCSGTSSNVTGTVAIGHGGTGATTRLGALQNLTNENVGSNAQYFLTITSNWGKGGYTSVADARTVIGNVSSTQAGLAPKGAAVSSQSQSTKFLREDGSWAVPSYTTNTNTTYTFANGTNCFYVTPSGGSQQTITVTPSITNNVTGSGTSGYIAKFNGANTITNGPAFGSATTTYLRNDGSWTTPANATFTIGETADPDVTARKIKLTASGSGGSDSSIAVSYAANTSHLKHPNSATNTTWGTENLPIYLAADGAPLQCGFHVFTGTVAANSQVDLSLKFGLVIFGRVSTSATPSMMFIDQWGGTKSYYSNTTHVISVVTSGTTVRVKNNGSTVANYIAIGSTA